MTRYWFSWRALGTPRHRCMGCILISFTTTGGSHESAPTMKFLYMSFLFAWNDDDSQNHTFTIGRLFQSRMSNYSRQEKLEHLQYICVTFTIFFLWVNLWCFWREEDGCWPSRAWETNGVNTNKIRTHSYSNPLGDCIKTHCLISIKLCYELRKERVFDVCKVSGMSAMWHLHNYPATFSWWRPAMGMSTCHLAWVPRGLTSLRHANMKKYMKSYCYIWFSHFTLTETYQC